jgi:hypothetical protein
MSNDWRERGRGDNPSFSFPMPESWAGADRSAGESNDRRARASGDNWPSFSILRLGAEVGGSVNESNDRRLSVSGDSRPSSFEPTPASWAWADRGPGESNDSRVSARGDRGPGESNDSRVSARGDKRPTSLLLLALAMAWVGLSGVDSGGGESLGASSTSVDEVGWWDIRLLFGSVNVQARPRDRDPKRANKARELQLLLGECFSFI